MNTSEHPILSNLLFMKGVALASVLMLGVSFWNSLVISFTATFIFIVLHMVARIGEPASYLLKILFRIILGLVCIILVEEIFFLVGITLQYAFRIYLPILAYNMAIIEYNDFSLRKLTLQLLGFIAAVIFVGLIRELFIHGRIVLWPFYHRTQDLPLLDHEINPFFFVLFVSGGLLITGYIHVLLKFIASRKGAFHEPSA